MPGNTFGRLFRITTWGESHGPGSGVVIDGCPAGLALDLVELQAQLDRRRVGQSRMTSARREPDEVEVLSGFFEGRTTGTALALMIRNVNARSTDYDDLRDVYRPGHADFSYDAKYGFRDYRGGGRSSARETAARVAAGAIARQILAREGISLVGWTQRLAHLEAAVIDESIIEQNPMRCPDPLVAEQMVALVEAAKSQRDSLGGIVEVRARGVPAGLGEPVFDKLDALIGHAMFSIPAVKAVEIGDGVGVADLRGSQNNDPFVNADGSITTASNHAGGILGGISSGSEIVVRLTAKPPASIAQEQQTVDRSGQPTTIVVKGRHDPTVLPRLVPVAEAMLALVLVDCLLMQRAARMD